MVVDVVVVSLCYRTVVCLSVCFVILVYCDQMVGWIKMPLELIISMSHIFSML